MGKEVNYDKSFDADEFKKWMNALSEINAFESRPQVQNVTNDLAIEMLTKIGVNLK